MSDDRVAIVTGGAQGLGAAICKVLLKNGYKVCVADINEEKGHLFVVEQRQIYDQGRITFCHCDVTKCEDYQNVFENTLENFGKVDVLVNNAGVSFESNPRLVLEVNLLGPITGCYAAMKYMGKASGGQGGVVINMASVFGLVPAAYAPSYTATKHGVVGLTRSFGMPYHLTKEGLLFMALCPNFTDTEMLKQNRTLQSDANYSNTIRAVESEMLSPEYVAEAVIKLLQDGINGSVMAVTRRGYEYVEVPHELRDIVKPQP